MGLSKYLQSPEILKTVSKMPLNILREYVLEKCNEWHVKHPEEGVLIRENLKQLEIDVTEKKIKEIEYHIFLHYYEKFVPHTMTPEQYAGFLEEHVDYKDAVSQLQERLDEGKGILMPTAHFGGIEFLIPSLSYNKLPLSTAVRFTTERFSKQMHDHAVSMQKSGFFSLVNIIEIGKPGTMVALGMAAVLRRKEILFSVFDEKTDHSIPVTLFGKKLWGGAGLDKILKFLNVPLSVFTIYMIRTGEFSFKLQADEIDITSENPVQGMFDSLENVVKAHLEQWYFLHEEIPFVD